MTPPPSRRSSPPSLPTEDSCEPPWRRHFHHHWHHHNRRHYRRRGHHRHDLQHLLFRWLVGVVLVSGFFAANLGVFAHRAGLAHGWFWLALAAVLALFWKAAGHIARRLSRPMAHLADVARNVGRTPDKDHGGNTGSELNTHPVREIRLLSLTLTDMARRIEQQMSDQRELLAAVSHELRSPLSRVRVLLEMARGQANNNDTLDSIEEEVLACDHIIGTMLASSRVEFDVLDKRPVQVSNMAERALQRAGLPPSLLLAGQNTPTVTVDATLIAQALANLIENAIRHGQGVTRLRLEVHDGNEADSPKGTMGTAANQACFTIEDNGPGFTEDTQTRAFDSFHRTQNGATQGLGLGLSLVKKIAQAHGGRAWAHNRPGGGAEVGFSVEV